jgi:hypothetical protein
MNIILIVPALMVLQSHLQPLWEKIIFVRPETGFLIHGHFYMEPLWDGEGYRAGSACCTFNTPPWFYKQLPQPTTDDIKIRVCMYEARIKN